MWQHARKQTYAATRTHTREDECIGVWYAQECCMTVYFRKSIEKTTAERIAGRIFGLATRPNAINYPPLLAQFVLKNMK